MNNEKTYSKRLSHKFIVGFLILGIFVIASGCMIGYMKYTQVIEKMYNDTAYHIADMVKEDIDGDLIEDYFVRISQADEENLEAISEEIQQEDAYQVILGDINAIRENMGANYIYLADMRDEQGNVISELTYMFDAENPDDEFPSFVPGNTGPMNEAFLADAAAIYETGKRSDNYFYSHSDFGYNTSAISPIKNSDGEVVAIVGVELAMKTLQMARMEYVFYVAVFGAVFTALIIAVFLAYLRRKVIDPIRLVTEEADAFVHNETEISKKLTTITTGDEIEKMANSVYQMEVDIHKYIDELTTVTAERERIGAELNIATKIQADMLPNIFPAFPEREEFDIYASMSPAKEVGGDFYDFFMVDDDHLAMVMADVSGKGVPAALFMVISKTVLKNYAQNGLSAKAVLEETNNSLCENNEADMFVTVWIGILEISTGKLICSNAGHEYPAICRKGGQYELFKDKHGFVLAGMKNTKQHEYEITLEPGDKIFLYTDGVPEATNAEEVLYETKRMIPALNTVITANPKATLAAVKEDIDLFVGEAEQFDDITMMCLQYKGKGASDAPENKRAEELTVGAEEENVVSVTEFVEGIMEEAAVPMKVQTAINIAIDELFSNIARYGYSEKKGKVTVRVELTESPQSVRLTFIDKGIPYNPLEKEDPDVTLSAEERQIGGLGIYMVKKSMDEMTYRYEDGQNILTIRKNC